MKQFRRGMALALGTLIACGGVGTLIACGGVGALAGCGGGGGDR